MEILQKKVRKKLQEAVLGELVLKSERQSSREIRKIEQPERVDRGRLEILLFLFV